MLSHLHFCVEVNLLYLCCTKPSPSNILSLHPGQNCAMENNGLNDIPNPIDKEGHEGTDGDLVMFTEMYFVFAIINTLIAIPVIMMDFLVVKFYKAQFRKFVPCMYLLISISDGLTATFAIVASGLIMAAYWQDTHIIPRGAAYSMIITTAGWEVFYRISVFLNLLLSIARTIKIRTPFYIIKMKASVSSVTIYSALWFSVAIADAMIMDLSDTVRYVKNAKLGLPIGGYVKDKYNDTENGTFYGATTELIFILIPFIIPAILSCVCLFLLYQSLSQPPPNEQSAVNQRHVTTTVTYLTLLFCICNSASTLYFVFAEYIYELFLGNKPLAGDEIMTCLLSLTLPLLNAAVSPIIIIARSSELSSRIQQLFRIRLLEI